MAGAPLANAYWLEPARVLAGEHPWGGSETATSERLSALLDAGIDCFIDLTEPGEIASYEHLLRTAAPAREVRYLRLPLPDHGVPDSEATMRRILESLDRTLGDGRCVYLHCRAGIGRTNMVAGCWLAERAGSGEPALARLNRLWRASARSRAWPTVPETPEQVAFVRAWRPRAAAPAAARPAPAQGFADRVRGMLLGLAAGDAAGHAVHGLPPGAWADRTAMALCLAESLVARGGHDAKDQVERYLAWQRTGHWSSTGACVGISQATRRALAAAQWTGIAYSGSHDPARADDEPLARIGPAVAWLHRTPLEAIETAVHCARITHQAPLTLDAVRLVAALLAGALAGAAKDELLAPGFSPAPDFDPTALREPVGDIAAGAWRTRRPRHLRRGRLQAAAALESALAAFERGSDPASCIEAAASRPGDASAAAAIAGTLAGAHYGASALPAGLREGIARAAEIEALADELASRAGGGG